MFRHQRWIHGTFVFSLIFVVLFFEGCTVYRNMRPTGDYTTINREKVKDEYTFRMIQAPLPEKPSLVVKFGTCPVYNERRKVGEEGQKKVYFMPAWLALTAGGVAMAIAGWDEYELQKGDNGDTTRFYRTRTTGVLIGIVGAGGAIADLARPWKMASKYNFQTLDVKDEDQFQPLANKRVRAFFLAIGKELKLITDEKGQVSLDISEIAASVSEGTSLQVRFESEEFSQVSNTFTIPSNFFTDLKTYYASIRPPKLITNLAFDDAASWRPNKIIDGAEKAYLIATIENRGEGKALDVKLRLDSNQPKISINPNLDLGIIEPGQKIEKQIPITADMEIADDKATFTAYTKEQRGYDATRFQLNVNMRHLDKPLLSYTSFKINDGVTGMAKGNNNGIVESDETIEITAFIHNGGVGQAMNTQLKVTSPSLALDLRKNSDDLKTIAPGETKNGKVVIYIPRTFAEKEILLQFSSEDMLGASIAQKEYRIPVKVRAPLLAYEHTILSSDGVEVNQVNNGADYQLEITPRNEGSIDAQNVRISVSATSGVELRETSRTFAQIAANASVGKVIFPFSLPRTFTASEIKFSVQMTQDDFSPTGSDIPVVFFARKPQLTAQTRFLNAQGEPTISQGEYGELHLIVQNTGNLSAEKVVATLALNDPGIDLLEPTHEFGRIPSGQTVLHKFRFYVKNSSRAGAYAPKLLIAQADGFSSLDQTLKLQIVEAGATVVEVVGKESAGKQPPIPALSGVRGNQPPRVKITPRGVSENMRASDAQVKIDIRITDDKPILGLEPEILVNGKTQTKEMLLRGISMSERQLATGDNELQLVRTVQLEEGINEIVVRFMDSDNLEDSDKARVEYGSVRAKIYALIAGVSEYANPKIEGLRFGHKDAQKFADFLQSPSGGAVPREHIRILTNQEATRSNILRSLNEVLGRALENDVVYLYMAMHAMPERSGQPLFFMAYDSNPDDLWSTAIEQNQLQGILQNAVRSNKVIWIADACHAGTLGSQTIATRSGQANITNRLLREMSKARNGLALFMAASANQTSQEADKWGGGVFTHYLLKGLQGEADTNGNKFVSLSELADYVRRAVADATNGEQRPEVEGDYDRNLEVGVVRK